jgi:AcrR family transcriptional regulator
MATSARTPRHSARRAEILDGLVELFLAEGFLNFSVEDLAERLQCSKSTLYAVAPSKEQLITAVVRAFFRRAAERVDATLARETDPVARIGTYLEAISAELAPASSAFFADLDMFTPAREIYVHNTAIAARNVQDLVRAAGLPARTLDAAFIGAVAGATMESIQRGEIAAMTGLSSAAAYRLLADLIVASVTGSSPDLRHRNVRSCSPGLRMK